MIDGGFWTIAAKTVTPKTVSEVKLIHGGKVLENSKTLADSRIMSFGNLPGGVITMHVVVQPTIAKEKKGWSSNPVQFVCGAFCYRNPIFANEVLICICG